MARKRTERLKGASPVRVLIVDDHAVLRAGLRMLLQAEPDIDVVGEAADGAEAVARARELAPDIVLLDVAMPQVGGLEVVPQIREVSPKSRVLMLTMYDDEGYLREALAAGSSGYVLKRAADIELLTAIRVVHRGGTYLHAAHTKVLFERAANEQASQETGQSEPRLSPREDEVLRLIALGYTNQQSADQLCLSVKTVETYRSRLMTKLGLSNRAELVRHALKQGLLDEG